MLEKTRSLLDDERAHQIAQCCIADARGRTGFESREYSQAALFLTYQKAAKSVDGGMIANHCKEQGRSGGLEIQKAIHDARVSAIKFAQQEASSAT